MSRAVRAVHDTAAEAAAEAQRTIRDYDMVTDICRACQPAANSSEFLTSLRKVCVESNTAARFKDLCHVGLMFSFVAAIEHLCAIENKQLSSISGNRKLKLTALCLKTMSDSNSTFSRHAKHAGLTDSLARLLCCVQLPCTVASTVCDVIATCIKSRDPDTIYDLVRNKCLQGLMIHFKKTYPYYKLLSELLHQGSCCHFLLHDLLRANHMIGNILFTIDLSTSSEIRHLAGRCLNLLLDFDLVRTTMYINDLSPSFTETLLHQLGIPNLMRTAMIVVQATLNVQRFEFEDLIKNSRRYSTDSRTLTAMQWVTAYNGLILLSHVTSALRNNRSCELHSSGPAIIEQLCQIVVITPEQCHDALNVMMDSIHVMVSNNNTYGAKNALSAITYLLQNGKISVNNAKLKAAVRHMAMLFGIKFDHHCRDRKFITVRTLPLHDSCSICAEVYNDTDHIAVRTHCAHEFCKHCLDKWINSNVFTVSCPICRSSGVDIVQEVLGDRLNNSGLFAKRHLRFG